MPEQPDPWAREREILLRPPTPEDLELDEAYEWCIREPWVQERHLGEIVVAQKGIIWGSGRTRKEAWAMALSREGCPDKHRLVCVVVPGVVVPAPQPDPEGVAS